MTGKRLFAGCLFASLALLPRTAGGHGLLLSSSPRAGENLTVAPRQIRLVFSERPERFFTRITLISPNGSAIALDTISIGPGYTATARITGAMTAGIYRVEWRSAGLDGHPVRGDFSFAIAPDAVGIVGEEAIVDTGARPEASRGQAPEVAATSPVFAPIAAVLRWLTLSAVIAAIGAVTFRVVVISRVEREMDPQIANDYLPGVTRATAKLGLAAAAVIVLVALFRLVLQVLTIDGTGPAGTMTQMVVMLSRTAWGWAWWLHVGSALVAAAGYALAKGPRDRAWIVAAVGSVTVALSLALSGHAMVVPELAAATVVAHVVHTVAAAGWLGTLLATAVVGLPLAFRLDHDDRWTVVADIIHTFSPAALAFAGITALAGVFIAWTHLGSLNALWSTEYGGVLLFKLGLIAGTAAIGAYNWLRVRPSLGEAIGARRLRRSAAVELGIGALVVAVTAVLVATPMPVR